MDYNQVTSNASLAWGIAGWWVFRPTGNSATGEDAPGPCLNSQAPYFIKTRSLKLHIHSPRFGSTLPLNALLYPRLAFTVVGLELCYGPSDTTSKGQKLQNRIQTITLYYDSRTLVCFSLPQPIRPRSIMSATTKASLTARLAELTASVEALPEDVFSDVIARNQVQSHVANIKAVVDTPLESVFEMCFQVRIWPPRLCNPGG